MSVVALVPAAGSGQRLGANVPKAFVTVGGRALLVHAVDRLLAAGVDRVVVAVPADAFHADLGHVPAKAAVTVQERRPGARARDVHAALG